MNFIRPVHKIAPDIIHLIKLVTDDTRPKELIRVGTADVCRNYYRASYSDAFRNEIHISRYELLLQYKIPGRV
jgi:hypothetical protein